MAVVNELDRTLRGVAAAGRKALIAYVAGGYPALAEEAALVRTIVDAGADIVEIGVPFSDPIADGPTIQFASNEALKNGATLRRLLPWVASLKKKLSAPIVFMSYVNPILAYGVDRFFREAKAAGASGVILPDMIVEEADDFRVAAKRNGLHVIFLVAPTTPPERARRIVKATGGFLYAVSVAGVTGARRALPAETKSWLSGLRKMSPVPVCVGFGISGPEHIRALRSSADGFIVGSALVNQIRYSSKGDRPARVRRFIGALAKECNGGR